MSTTYHPLREPFTEIAHISGGPILLFVGGAEVGRIVVPDDDVPTVLRLFADRDHPIRSNMRGTSAPTSSRVAARRRTVESSLIRRT